MGGFINSQSDNEICEVLNKRFSDDINPNDNHRPRRTYLNGLRDFFRDHEKLFDPSHKLNRVQHVSSLVAGCWRDKLISVAVSGHLQGHRLGFPWVTHPHERRLLSLAEATTVRHLQEGDQAREGRDAASIRRPCGGRIDTQWS